MSEFVETPQNVEDYIENVRFQLESIEGYLSILKDNESAAIKAKYLIKAAQKLSEKLDSLTI